MLRKGDEFPQAQVECVAFEVLFSRSFFSRLPRFLIAFFFDLKSVALFARQSSSHPGIMKWTRKIGVCSALLGYVFVPRSCPPFNVFVPSLSLSFPDISSSRNERGGRSLLHFTYAPETIGLHLLPLLLPIFSNPIWNVFDAFCSLSRV